MTEHIRIPANLIYTELTDSDKEIHIRLGLREVLRPDRYEGFRQGGRASAYVITLAGRWPIPLEEISMKVHLWQGEDDKSVGGMGRQTFHINFYGGM